MVLTERDVRLIHTVKSYGALTREQIARLLGFGSITRVNAVLHRLARHWYLMAEPQPSLRGSRRLVYSVGPAAAEFVAQVEHPFPKPRRWAERSDLFIEHQLRVNDVRISFAALESEEEFHLSQWLSEDVLKGRQLGLVPDAYFEYELHGNAFAAFVEADLGTEPMNRWREKTKGYTTLAFSGLFRQIFSREFFRVLVVTTSVRRLMSIAKTIAQPDRPHILADHVS